MIRKEIHPRLTLVGAGPGDPDLITVKGIKALADADVILFVTDATHWMPEDDDVLKRLRNVQVPVVAVLNKVDKVHPKEHLLNTIGLMSARHDFAEIVPVSALKQDNLDHLMTMLPAFLPENS